MSKKTKSTSNKKASASNSANSISNGEAAAPSVSDFYTIAIGASAGGLEALKAFFDQIPTDCSHSFVVIQHLSPGHKSLMTGLLAKNTDLPIYQVEDNMEVTPGSIYLIPPNHNMTILDGVLQLTEKPKETALNLPIDIFFKSLAKEKGEKAIAIVLTGTGSDGTSGVRAIKDVGGTVLVQDPHEAKFDGMPLSAIRTGLVDYVLPLSKLPGELLSFIAHPISQGIRPSHIKQDENLIERVLEHVNNITELDFSPYKRPTLVRRIERRMSINKCSTLKEYLELIYNNSDEPRALSREFLIGVTKFFRDSEAWKMLAKEVLPNLVKSNAAESGKLRVWSVACSTGEEAYSMAMLLDEEQKKQNVNLDVTIFATDIDEASLDVARRAQYSESIVADVTNKRLQNYFIKRDEEYQVANALRKMVIFSYHNILNDPPLNHIDIVICRNLLIYFQPDAQARVLDIVNYALKENGVLMLGPSETIGQEQKGSFGEIHEKAKLFRNLSGSRMLGIESFQYPELKLNHIRHRTKGHQSRDNRLAEVMSEALTNDLELVGVYVDERFDILHAVGNVRSFLELPEEGFSVNLLSMLPDKVAVAINATLRKAKLHNERTAFKGLQLVSGEGVTIVDVLVTPFSMGESNQHPYFLIVFLPKPATSEQPVIVPVDSDEFHNMQVADLERELKETQLNLQAMMEAADIANEELQATNEELLAANEELQSTNEELQSMNEELHTVNFEYQLKNEELATLNADMDNLLNGTGIGTIFLDNNMCIRRFTPSIRGQFELRASDIGRPISNFRTHIGNANIQQDAKRVLETQKPVLQEIRASEGKWFLQNIMPFKTAENEFTGIVITFVDISQLKEAQRKYAAQNAAFLQVLDGTMAGYWDRMLIENNLYLSPTFKKMFGYEDDEIENSMEAWHNLIHPDDLPRVLDMFDQHIASGGAIPYDLDVRYKHKEGHIVWVVSRGRVIEWDENNNPVRMAGSHVDITGLMMVQKDLERSNDELEKFAYIASHDLRAPLRNIENLATWIEDDAADTLNKESKGHLAQIKSRIKRLDNLFDDLLEFSRIGRIRHKGEDAMLAELVEKVIDLVEPPASFELVNLCGDVRATIPRGPIEVIMRNLISNAIKHHHDDTGRVEISSKISNHYLELAVTDDGPGIAPEFQEQIFDLFQTLRSKDEVEGSGMGLAFVRKLAENYDATVDVQSEEGKGARFRVRFPLLPEYKPYEGETALV